MLDAVACFDAFRCNKRVHDQREQWLLSFKGDACGWSRKRTNILPQKARFPIPPIDCRSREAFKFVFCFPEAWVLRDEACFVHR
jgi:hypothetical protein